MYVLVLLSNHKQNIPRKRRNPKSASMRLVWLLLQKQSCHFLRSAVLSCTAVQQQRCICILFVIKSCGKLNFEDKCLFSWRINMFVSSTSPGTAVYRQGIHSIFLLFIFSFEWSFNRIKQQLFSKFPSHFYPWMTLRRPFAFCVSSINVYTSIYVHPCEVICHRHVKNLPINFTFQKCSLPTVWHRFHWLSPQSTNLIQRWILHIPTNF